MAGTGKANWAGGQAGWRKASQAEPNALAGSRAFICLGKGKANWAGEQAGGQAGRSQAEQHVFGK